LTDYIFKGWSVVVGFGPSVEPTLAFTVFAKVIGHRIDRFSAKIVQLTFCGLGSFSEAPRRLGTPSYELVRIVLESVDLPQERLGRVSLLPVERCAPGAETLIVERFLLVAFAARRFPRALSAAIVALRSSIIILGVSPTSAVTFGALFCARSEGG